MARPVKNSCDYFSHDCEMRNHRKIKALRTKFGITGYGIWVMFLEFLTGADGTVFENSSIEKELISGDFGVSVTEISDVINYCLQIELLFEKDGFIHSESLNERLLPVFLKRGKAKEQSQKQKRINGKFISVTETTVPPVLLTSETPQTKVNKTKGNYYKGENLNLQEEWKNMMCIKHKLKTHESLSVWISKFNIHLVTISQNYIIEFEVQRNKIEQDYKKHFNSWLQIQFKEQNKVVEYKPDMSGLD